MKKIFLIFILPILYEIICSGLVYLSKSQIAWDYLKKINIFNQSLKIDKCQDVCLILSIVLSAIFLSINLIRKNLKYEKIQGQRNSLMKMNKENLGFALKEYSTGFSDFDMRIFVPKYPRIYKILDYKILNYIPFLKKRIFTIKNIDLLANEGATKGLEFEVSPNVEGLVGQCYQEQGVILDDNLEITNAIKYSLKQSQIYKTANLKWSICCPIFEDNSDNIIAIIALDGTNPIKINEDKIKELSDFLCVFLTRIYDVVPHLFKDKI